MIHKLFFSLITVFWILGISQGYVLGQDNSTEVEAQFTIRNRLDIDAMMKLAGYENRGDFLSTMEKVTLTIVVGQRTGGNRPRREQS